MPDHVVDCNAMGSLKCAELILLSGFVGCGLFVLCNCRHCLAGASPSSPLCLSPKRLGDLFNNRSLTTRNLSGDEWLNGLSRISLYHTAVMNFYTPISPKRRVPCREHIMGNGYTYTRVNQTCPQEKCEYVAMSNVRSVVGARRI